MFLGTKGFILVAYFYAVMQPKVDRPDLLIFINSYGVTEYSDDLRINNHVSM